MGQRNGMIGRVLTRYKILEEVGQGGMAVVYKGLDTALGREVAVKVLHPHLANHDESRARLEREAQAVAKLRHENILEIFDYSGPDSPESFIVTEFIHGPTLTQFLKLHPIPLPEVAAMIASEVARALEHAHGLGVIHRDVKPENVMFRPDGRIVLTDFGIAQIVDKERMTVTGQLLGSPAYMSPEHVEGGRIDFRTDVFACGTLTYQLATGSLPFHGKNPHEVLKKIAECRFAPPDQVNPLISAALARIIGKALAKSPEGRHRDAATLRRELCEELATVGVTDPRAELARFFADPAGWEKSFRPKLVAALAASGREAAGKGRQAAALGLWCRALTVAPDNAEVKALVEAMGQRRRVWRLVGVAASVGTLTALAFLGMRLLTPHQTGPDMGHPPEEIEEPSQPTESLASAGKLGKSATAITRRKADFHRASALFRPSTIALVQPRNVKINVNPKNVEILVDGHSQGHYDGGPIEVQAGPRTLTFRSECCQEKTILLAADQTETPQVRLERRSSYLSVITTPDDANLTFTTEANRSPSYGQGGKPLVIKFPPEHEPLTMQVFVEASYGGYESNRKTCVVTAGKNASCSIDLQRAR